ncbi:hypothetical protein PAI11_01330 [Patulibacter medicamentivorans]|jgi:hypothetical protein|uniref:N-terminal of MaoC-like dehydratase domain-containing protein n=2 Tax=Patulibacter medicamentivorans TaxID=1097667 RepID=H0E028_9ACTN|nr:hypothetical protein PAI11_01330 [Patulibacter medicamentivorans]
MTSRDVDQKEHMTDTLSNIAFDDLVEDDRKGPYVEQITADLAGRLAGPIGQPHDVALAPPAVFPVIFLKALRASMGGIPAGSVLAKQELRFGEPVPVGESVRTTTWIGEKYVRRERPYVVIRFDVRRADGALAVSGSKTIMWPTGPGDQA